MPANTIRGMVTVLRETKRPGILFASTNRIIPHISSILHAGGLLLPHRRQFPARRFEFGAQLYDYF
jgi:hypothetical protein